MVVLYITLFLVGAFSFSLGTLVLVFNLMAVSTFDTTSFVFVLLGAVMMTPPIIVVVKSIKEGRRQRIEHKIIRRGKAPIILEQRTQSRKLLARWNPKPWKDYTNNVFKVPASIYGNFDRVSQHWNRQDMLLTIMFKGKNYSTDVDFETCLKIEDNSLGHHYHTHCQDNVDRILYLYYRGEWYFSFTVTDPEDMIVLIKETERRKDTKLKNEIERARIRLENNNRRSVREPIPKDVQIFVWNRDAGKCVKCGSNKNLEYDHIIPLSKGGSNTVRNIQLLCQSCNREKGASIGYKTG